MTEIKHDLTLKKSNFEFLLCLKTEAIQFILMRPFTGQRHNYFPSRCTSNLMLPAFTGYVIGCKHSLQLKNSSKLRLKKQISRNLLRKNADGRLRRPGVTCYNNVKMMHFVTSLTS